MHTVVYCGAIYFGMTSQHFSRTQMSYSTPQYKKKMLCIKVHWQPLYYELAALVHYASIYENACNVMHHILM